MRFPERLGEVDGKHPSGIGDQAHVGKIPGIKEFVAPGRNRKDLVDVPRKVRREITIHFVERMDEVLEQALLDRSEGDGQLDATRFRRYRRRTSTLPPASGRCST